MCDLRLLIGCSATQPLFLCIECVRPLAIAYHHHLVGAASSQIFLQRTRDTKRKIDLVTPVNDGLSPPTHLLSPDSIPSSSSTSSQVNSECGSPPRKRLFTQACSYYLYLPCLSYDHRSYIFFAVFYTQQPHMTKISDCNS